MRCSSQKKENSRKLGDENENAISRNPVGGI